MNEHLKRYLTSSAITFTSSLLVTFGTAINTGASEGLTTSLVVSTALASLDVAGRATIKFLYETSSK